MESDTINLTLPIKIPYEVLQQLTDKALIGMEIGSGERKQGKIMGTTLGASALPEYDIMLGLEVLVTRRILMTKQVELFIHVALDYDPDTGILSAGSFKIDSKSRNVLLNATLKLLANRMYYRKVLDKATYNLYDLISPHRKKLNHSLEPGFSFPQGITVQGNMEDISLPKIEILIDHVLVHALFSGTAEVTVQKIPDNFSP